MAENEEETTTNVIVGETSRAHDQTEIDSDSMTIEKSTSDVWEMKSIKIESLTGLLTRKIIDFEKTSTKVEEAILGRISDNIRANHEKEYEPEIIAIGPYHRSIDSQKMEINPRLKPMEDVKLQFLSDLCRRVAKAKNMAKEDVLGNITDVIQEHKDKARKKYSQSLLRKMCSEDFVQMLVLDGCFIVELLLKDNQQNENELSHALSVTFQVKIFNSVFRDLLLYENQIPFFILEEIHGTCFPTTATDMSNSQSIRSLAIEFFGYEEEFRNQNIHHLLHLYHKIMVGEENPRANNDEVKDPENCTTIFYNVIKTIFNSVVMFMIFIVLSPVLLVFGFLLLIWSWWKYCWNTNKYVAPMEIEYIHPATRLAEFGVQFRRKEIVGSVIDVSFKDGIVEIPYMNIHYNTSSIYRNFLALEQSCFDVYGNKFTRYVVFMDDLIDTTDDVALLRREKILCNDIGSEEEVAKLFNELRLGLIYKDDYLIGMNEKINEYCGEIYNKWRATLMRDYLNSPWSIISVLAVSFVIYLTVVQTVWSIFQAI